jgi:hypothetical protein
MRTLTITNLKQSDDGKYVCTGEAGGQTSESVGILQVQSKTWTSQYNLRIFQWHQQFVECQSDDFTCSDGSCIGSFRRCDFFEDCSNGEDELDCRELQFFLLSKWENILILFYFSACVPPDILCNNGTCLGEQFGCNGVQDCQDGADEENCGKNFFKMISKFKFMFALYLVPVCRPEQFTCAKSGKCIDLNRQCNYINDCSDASDEKGCRKFLETKLLFFLNIDDLKINL